MKLTVYSTDASSSSEKDFAIPEFEDNRGEQALKDLLVAYHANRRQGTAKVKTRSEVAGSGKKIFRQKGTGNARHGDKLAPIFVGGGIAHGPKPRDWSKRTNKKAKRLAFGRALFDKASDGEVAVIEAFDLAAPQTKGMVELLGKIRPEGKVLLVDDGLPENATRAARGIERVTIVDAKLVNAWDLVRHQNLIISEKALEALLTRTRKPSVRQAEKAEA